MAVVYKGMHAIFIPIRTSDSNHPFNLNEAAGHTDEKAMDRPRKTLALVLRVGYHVSLGQVQKSRDTAPSDCLKIDKYPSDCIYNLNGWLVRL